MKDLQENIVPSENQNKTDYFSEGNGGLKILFVGNSISRHAPKPDMGWYGDWGMAASEAEKDYLHLIVAKIKEKIIITFQGLKFLINLSIEPLKSLDFSKFPGPPGLGIF